VRGAIFDRLQCEIAGARVLDLFAGSGALSIEALSRGAMSAVCVESQPAVFRFLREQINALDLQSRIVILATDSRSFLRVNDRSVRFDLVLLDPPYGETALLAEALCGLVEHGWLAARASIVCEFERGRREPPMVMPRALVSESRKEYGQTVLKFLRYTEGTDEHKPPGGDA